MSAHRRSFAVVSFLLVSLAAAAAGCFSPSGRTARVVDSASGADPSATPFKLEVVEELHDGADLVIKGRLTPKSEWPTGDVVVMLAALDDSGRQRMSFHRMSDLAPQSAMLAAGKPEPFSLTIPSSGLTNYQIEVLWGRDAGPFLGKEPDASSKPEPPQEQEKEKEKEAPKHYLALRKLEVHRVPGESCANPNECELKFTITGEFFNSGGATVRNVVIAAGFTSPDQLDLKDQKLENERRVEVRNLALQPGASKPFRLTLEKFVAAADQSAPQPVVRIVSIDSGL